MISSALEIRRAAAENYGTYICKAILLNSSIAAVAEKSISITRDSAPTQVIAPMRAVVVKEQSDVRLTCEAIGQPLSRIMWFKNNNETVIPSRASVDKVILIYSDLRILTGSSWLHSRYIKCSGRFRIANYLST